MGPSVRHKYRFTAVLESPLHGWGGGQRPAFAVKLAY
jgi:hypothetical protein